NADDFGYFDGVSRGILEVAESGRLTATGIMANGPALERWIGPLLSVPTLSAGVHLNATLGEPLSVGMKQALTRSGGSFPAKGKLAAALLLGRIAADVVMEEWRMQIRRCCDLGVRPAFLNSHEHIHMLPLLYGRVRSLAAEFGIRHVRAPRAEWVVAFAPADLARNSALSIFSAMSKAAGSDEPRLLGVAKSGRLDVAYLEWRLQRLENGVTYELMCHPGRSDDVALADPKLAAYHDWEGELQTLLSPGFEIGRASC